MDRPAGRSAKPPPLPINTSKAAKQGGTGEPRTASDKGKPSAISDHLSSPPLTPRTPQTPRTPRSRYGARAGIGGFGQPSSSADRPQSAVSRKSNSHAPTIASQAFFRPMSSQRLQAQRGTRPTTATSQDVPRLSTSTEHRESLDTTDTDTRYRIDLPAPPSSNGSEHTARDPRGEFRTSSPGERDTIRSAADSSKPLHTSGRSRRGTETREAATPKTPKSYQGPPGSARAPLPPESKTAHHRQTSEESTLKKQSEGSRNLPLSRAKNYQYFTGNTVFCWGGRFQNAKHAPVNIFTGLAIVAPSVLFFVFTAPYLWYNVSPAIPIVFGYVFYVCLSSFVHASVTDPGIVPRNLHPLPKPEVDDPLAIPPSTEWTIIKSFSKDTPAMYFPTKYCKTCNIWRNPRTHHCRICDNCVETQDHHCVWLNNCVGRRNYRYFFTFVATSIVLGLFLSLASLGHLLSYMKSQNVDFVTAIENCRVSFAMFLYGILAISYPISLCGYHVFLMSRSETTREYLNSHKFLPKDRYRAFDHRNVIKNILVVLLRPRAPGYLVFKDKYVEGDPRFATAEEKANASAGAAKHRNDVEMQNVSTSFQGPSTRTNPRPT